MASPAAILSILVRAQGLQATVGQLGALERAGKKAGDATDAMAGKHQKSAEAINKAAKVGVLAVGGLAAGAVKMAGDYEQSMNTLQAVSGATGKEMDKLGKLSIKLGADVKLPGTSAQDAATAMQEMIKAGVSMKDTMAGVRGVLVLSAAAQVSNARAAEIASNALNTFKLKGKDVNFVVDQLANTANASSVEINDVADAMKMAGAVFSAFQTPARGAKGAMTDLNVAIGLLGNAGIKGSDAGTSLKQTLLQLTGPSDRAKGAMKALFIAAMDNTASEKQVALALRGTAKERGAAVQKLIAHNKALGGSADIAYTATGRMRGLKDIIALVTKGTAKMTDEEKNAYLTQIFGADATRSVISLMQAGPAAWDKMTGAVQKQGAAQALAAAKMKGFKGSMEALKSTGETLAISFGTVLLPPLTAFLQKLAGLGPFVEKNKTLIMVLVGALGLLAAGTWAVNLAMAANPFVAAAIGIALLVAGIIKAYQTSETFRAVIAAVFDAVKTAFTSTVAWIQGATSTVVGEISQWDTLFSAIRRGFDLVKAAAVLLFSVLKTTFQVGMLVLGPIVAGAWALIKGIFSGAWAAIRGIVVGGFTVLRGIVTVIGGLFKGDFGQVWRGIKTIFSGGITALKGILEGAWKILKAPVEAVAAGLHDAFSNSWDRIKAVFRDSINTVIDFLNLLIKAINAIPGVPDIGLIGKIGSGGGGGGKQANLGQTGHLARGGAFGRSGGMVNRPMMFMGEEAPRHPEYVIPTNPAYRGRARGLLAQAAGAIGLASGGVWGKGELADLWKRVNPGLGNPNLMAAIALAESGGRQGIVNSIGATGLWQIHPGGAQFLDPTANAREAGRKLATQGLRAWEAYTNGSYKQYLGGGNIFSKIGNVVSDVAGSVADLVGSLPGAKGLGWLGGVGKYVLGKAKDWITSKASSLFGGGSSGGGSGGGDTGGLVPRVVKALAFARSHGWGGSVTSGYRSVAEQQYLWDNASRLGLVRGKTVAAPGSSSHQRGEAVDVSDIPGFARAMAMMPAAERLYSLVVGDPVHFSVSGRRRGGVWGGLLGSYAHGTSHVPRTGPYLLHQGEAVIPQKGVARRSSHAVSAFDRAREMADAKTFQQRLAALRKKGLAPGAGPAAPAAVIGGDGGSGGDPNQALIDAINAAAAIQQHLDDEIAGLVASVDAQTAFAKKIESSSGYQAEKYLTELVSGRIIRGVIGRSATPGAGVEHTY